MEGSDELKANKTEEIEAIKTMVIGKEHEFDIVTKKLNATTN